MLLDGNPCTSDKEDELITTLPSTSSLKGEGYPQPQILALQQIAERGFYLPMLCWKLKQHQHQAFLDEVPIINSEVAAEFFERIYCATFCQPWSAEFCFGKPTNHRQSLA